MKERNLIILIVGIILVGLFLVSEISNFNFNNPTNDYSNESLESNNESPNQIDNNNNNLIKPVENPEESSNNEKTSQKNPSNSNNT